MSRIVAPVHRVMFQNSAIVCLAARRGIHLCDALHIATARKAQCGRIFTFNVIHFRQLAPDLLDRILAP